MVPINTMSTMAGEKIRAIRDAEGLSRQQFFELTGIPAGTQKHYEMGRHKSIGSEILFKITTHPRFQKYALWLMTDTTAPESGQIAPSLSPDGHENAVMSRRCVRKTG
ncbi:TPA: helix-turn-helix transcriptional regulator [Escherichia coli]|uniref:helix-turn-helix domain-containing protein n=2 Tax=Escherichia coli TaxID=562 RepID=UPI00097F7C56|nr:helix-turn-helix domain-containing protein [Escherichia coli]EET2789579.1 helix-turn-helix transcriptional regulator [Escherichia coli]EET9654624.1 helix-turn-helix transcriptional regulator [Escherichia coli]EEY7020509.1 helix-turn-helix transcriptional regulator [Escherichia coli]EFE1582180.1 helix-turn-helix transcriptional regulator [Escherichia coli]EFI6871704.1 helix-turn-helix transcriptional regulator [Escherichia coli]